eukprot:scaffold321091_cov33-Tisochrysis_lutea.AAC.2
MGPVAHARLVDLMERERADGPAEYGITLGGADGCPLKRLVMKYHQCAVGEELQVALEAEAVRQSTAERMQRVLRLCVRGTAVAEEAHQAVSRLHGLR